MATPLSERNVSLQVPLCGYKFAIMTIFRYWTSLKRNSTQPAKMRASNQLTQQCWPSGQTVRGPGKPAEEEPWQWERVAEEEQPWWSQDGAAGARERRQWGAKERERKSVDEAWRWWFCGVEEEKSIWM